MSILIGNQLGFQATTTLNSSNNTGKLESSLKNTESMEDNELLDVCKSFESYFVEQMFKEMRKTVPNSEDSNEYMNYFGDMLYEEYAKNITEGNGIGIAKMLYESMKRN